MEGRRRTPISTRWELATSRGCWPNVGSGFFGSAVSVRRQCLFPPLPSPTFCFCSRWSRNRALSHCFSRVEIAGWACYPGWTPWARAGPARCGRRGGDSVKACDGLAGGSAAAHTHTRVTDVSRARRPQGTKRAHAVPSASPRPPRMVAIFYASRLSHCLGRGHSGQTGWFGATQDAAARGPRSVRSTARRLSLLSYLVAPLRQ